MLIRIVFLVSIAAGSYGQGAGRTKIWTAPKNALGQPDLSGHWSFATVTPLERPVDLKDKEFLTDAEAAAYEKRVLAEVSTDRRDGGGDADVGRSYNEAWRDRGKLIGTRRTSLIVEPKDGRLPALTSGAQQRIAAKQAHTREHATDGPENRNLWERCLTRGSPMLPNSYNNLFQVVQAAGHVTVLREMIHEARVIPLDASPHPPKTIRLWAGDPRGHWEKNTLVIDTTNFDGRSDIVWFSPSVHLTERFTRTAADTLLYEFTVEDPETFARPWTAQIPTQRTDEQIYEYACHEGNLALADILAGARVQEKK